MPPSEDFPLGADPNDVLNKTGFRPTSPSNRDFGPSRITHG